MTSKIQNLLRHLFIILLWMPFFVSAQKNLSAGDHILQIEKQGVFVVVLQEHATKLKYFEKNGFQERAKELRNEIDQKNQAVSEAFHASFNFAPVYFIMSSDIENLKALNFQKIKLMDSNLKKVTANFSNKSVYIINPEQIIMKNIGSTGAIYSGISIMDDQYNSLPSKFPYYVRSHDGLFFLKRTELETVEVLQKKLSKYLRKTKKRMR